MKQFIAAVAVLVLGLTGRASATQSLFSGYEIFPGVGVFGITLGATFSGWTYNCPSEGDCQPPLFGGWFPFTSNSEQGLVSGSVNYKGTPGFPKNCTGVGCTNTVDVIGGKWSWNEKTDLVLSGRVLSGKVTWPGGSATNIGCGDGGATFIINVALGNSVDSAGNFQGCLNDQSPLPPKIWGEVDVDLWTQLGAR
jgi:hypothetical protein